MATIRANSIFTNCARTDDGDIWWEGMTAEPPSHAIDWHGEDWTPDSDKPAAHPNARFTTPAAQCPSIAPNWEDPQGVPIDAFLFGGRRATVVPLVTEAFDWEHGVFMGAIMASEKTAAATGTVGELRFDPMAMLPFCGYNMGDYFGHWLESGRRAGAKLPKIFMVNWFRKDDEGRFLWPGFGENSRVLAWVAERCDGRAGAEETPIGLVPSADAIDTSGLDVSPAAMAKLLDVDPDEWRAQLPRLREHLASFGDALPEELTAPARRARGAPGGRRLDDVPLGPLRPLGGERGHVHERLAAEVEVAHYFADPRRLKEAVPGEAGGVEEAARVGLGLADQRVVVGRHLVVAPPAAGDRGVEQHGRPPFKDRHGALEPLVLRLADVVGAEQKAAALGVEVEAGGEVDRHRGLALHLERARVGDPAALGGHGQLHTRQLADAARPGPRGAHHALGLDRARLVSTAPGARPVTSRPGAIRAPWARAPAA